MERECYLLPIGPYHPMLHEPEYLQVILEGERIIDLDIHLGYNHRGVEKIAASKPNIYQSLKVVERTCGICGEAHSACFVLGVEKILGIEVPERAKYIRTIMFELNRIQSHLLWLGIFAYELGFETLFQHTWADRSIIMNLLEKISGNRIHYCMNTIGGVTRDLTKDLIESLERKLKELEKRFNDRAEVFRTDSTVNKRTESVGTLNKKKARELGVVGPTARASGIKIDVRKDAPYHCYEDVEFRIVTRKEGDARARMLVRIEEVLESMEIIRQVLDKIPKGEINTNKRYFLLKEGEVTSVVEAPRGENLHFIKTDKERLRRIRIRPPTYANIFALREMLKGATLADIPSTLFSLDPCFSCCDRIVVIDLDRKKRDILNLEDLWHA